MPGLAKMTAGVNIHDFSAHVGRQPHTVCTRNIQIISSTALISISIQSPPGIINQCCFTILKHIGFMLNIDVHIQTEIKQKFLLVEINIAYHEPNHYHMLRYVLT